MHSSMLRMLQCENSNLDNLIELIFLIYLLLPPPPPPPQPPPPQSSPPPPPFTKFKGCLKNNFKLEKY